MAGILLDVITMEGNEFVLWDRGGVTFPHDSLGEGEQPAEAVRRIVKEWTGTEQPKVELVDLRNEDGALRLIFRAMLTSEPQGEAARHARGSLPGEVGALSGKYVEDALKTSLNYKLTRA